MQVPPVNQPTLPLQVPNSAGPLASLLAEAVRIDPDGLVHLDEGLLSEVFQHGSKLNEPLAAVLTNGFDVRSTIGALYVAQELAKTKTDGLETVFHAASRLHTHPNPLIQIYLAGFYRAYARPEAFGPMLSTLIHQSVNQYPQLNPMVNPTEEVGGTVLQLLAEKTAEETVRRLMPYLSNKPGYLQPPAHNAPFNPLAERSPFA